MKKVMPSRTDLRNLLMESLFDPRADGPMSVIVEMDSPEYCQLKVIEILKSISLDNYQESLTNCISLLVLARSFHGATQDKTHKERRPGVKNPEGIDRLPESEGLAG